MDETYDYIILGTGLTECVLSGLLSVDGQKVLHMDRNDYYGGASASLNLTQLYQKFRQTAPPSELGRDRDYAIDLIPKFIMASGQLTSMLVHTEVTRYLEFKQVGGSYVLRDGRINKVPATEVEALKSPLMGLFEKRRAKKFLEWVLKYNQEDVSTQQNIDASRTPMKDVYKQFGLEAGTQDFIGHAMALFSDDSYQDRPASETIARINLYTDSMARYGKSPYIYPLYGLGELPQGFARLSAIYGGTYMLDKKVDEIVRDDKGRFTGVRCGEETVKAKAVIGDPSYFLDLKTVTGEPKVSQFGRVVRAICLLKAPIPGTDDSDSLQIVLPQNQIGRKHDIYIACVSEAHKVCAKGFYVAIVSTVVETSAPENEIQAGLKLLGPIHEKFVTVDDLWQPDDSGKDDGIYVTKSYDATSHFESVTEDVEAVWMRAMSKPLVLKKKEDSEAAVAA